MHHRPNKLVKGLLAGALAVGASAVLAAPALANTVTVGNLQFTSNDEEFIGTSTQVAGTAPAVTIDGGDIDMTVTQLPLSDANPAINQITIGGTTAYTGEITFQNVNLSSSAHDLVTVGTQNGANIIFDGCTLKTTGAYAVLTVSGSGNDITFQGTNSLSADGDAAIEVTANSSPANSITFAGNNTIESTGDFAALSLPGSSNDFGTVNITFESGNTTLSGGSTTSSNIGVIDIPAGSTTTGELNIDTQVATTISGNGSQYGPALNSNGTATITCTGNGELTFEMAPPSSTAKGEAAVVFGAATIFNVGDGAFDGNVIIQGGNANTTGGGGNGLSNSAGNATIRVDAGTLEIYGGNAAGATQTGGNGIDIATTLTTTIEVNGGVLDVVGGTGNGGAGGTAIEGGADVSNSVVVTGGSLTATGGSGGEGGTQGNGIECATLNVSNGGPETQGSSGPTITASGNIALYKDDASVTTTLTSNAYGRKGYYPWLVQTAGNPAGDNPVMVDFASSPTSVQISNISNTNAVQWVEIGPHALQSVSIGVTVDSPVTPNPIAKGAQAPYVVAATDARGPYNTYTLSATGVFENVSNDLSTAANFENAAGMDALSDGAITPEENVVWNTSVDPATFYVPATAQGNKLEVSAEGTLPRQLTSMYPNLTFTGTNEIPVVYTVTVASQGTYGLVNNKPVNNRTGLSTANVYTDAEGTGTLVAAVGDDAQKNDMLIVANTAPNLPDYDGLNTVAAAATNTSTPDVIGLFNGNEQVSLAQISGWDSNATLTVAWGDIELTSIAPSSEKLPQGDSTTLTATYTVTPANADLTGWTWDNSGLPVDWQGYLLSGSQQTGSAAINGVTVKSAEGTTSDSAPFTCEVVADVAANSVATLGDYVIYPQLANAEIPNNGAVTTDLVYSTVTVVASSTGDDVTIYRLYNQWSHEHLYTESVDEYNSLVDDGWDDEGTAWVAPATSTIPVYRLFNPYNQDHYYCTSKAEADGLVDLGWRYDFDGGAAFYSAGQDGVPIYQLFNPYETSNTHLWTGDYNEYTDRGWMA